MLVIEKYLMCNGCNEVFGLDSRKYTASEYRKLAKKYEGWIHTKGKDYCFKCILNKKEKEKNDGKP